jgi:hypothetical protein
VVGQRPADPPPGTPELDRSLLSLAKGDEKLTYAAIAARLTDLTGLPINEEQARGRARRIARSTEAYGSARVLPSDETLFDIPAAGSDFVGIRTIWWDLETTNLTAIMGRVLACAFADSWGQAKVFRYEDYPGTTLIDDGPLVIAIRDELEKAGHWVTWNGKLFDVPFLNARLLKANQRPLHTDIMHTDLMYYSRGQFVRIGSSKLVNVSEFVKSPNRKTPISWETWQLAATGDRTSMDLVCEHARADVLVTRDVSAVLFPHVRNIHR